MNDKVTKLQAGASSKLHLPARALLALLFCLVAAVAVSAQEDAGERDLGGPIVLSQEEGPDGTTTIVEIPVAKDTYISSANPNTNFGTAASIRLGHQANGDAALRPLVQFSMSSIPEDAVVNQAFLQIYLFQATGGTEPMPFEIRHLVSTWSEGLVTWNDHQPEWGDIYGYGVATSTPLGWKELDVTPLVREWVQGTQANNGVIAIGDERPGVEIERWYYAKEAGNLLYPRLVVDYTIPPPDSVAPTASVEPLPAWSADSFTVRWDGQDNPGGSGIAYYDVQYRVNYGLWTDWEMHTTDKSAEFDGGAHLALYEFRARAVDHRGNSGVWPLNPQASTRVDTMPPTTYMNPLPEYTTSSSFNVSWQGFDNQSGINHYDLEGRINGGPWTKILESTLLTSYRVAGLANGDQAEFRVRATDNVGNAQPFPEVAQASTTVILEPVAVVQPFDPLIMTPTDPLTDSFDVSWVGFTAPGTSITLYELRYRFIASGTGTVTSWANVPLPNPTAQSVTFSGPFTQDGTYQFEVRAVNSLGQSEAFTGKAEAYKIIDLRAPFYEVSALLPILFR